MKTPVTRDQALAECMPFLENIARHWARISRFYEFDDLLNEAVAIVLEHLDNPPRDKHLLGRYLVSSARWGIIRMVTLKAANEPMSLDEPFSDSSDATLLDILPAPTSTEPARDYEALYSAIATLPYHLQAELSRFYRLSLQIKAPKRPHYAYNFQHRDPSPGALRLRRSHAIKKLRANVHLHQAVMA